MTDFDPVLEFEITRHQKKVNSVSPMRIPVQPPVQGISGSEDTTVILWDLETGSFLHTFYHDEPVLALQPHELGHFLSHTLTTVRMWDLAGQCLLKIPVAGMDHCSFFSHFQDDGKMVDTFFGGCVAIKDGYLQMWIGQHLLKTLKDPQPTYKLTLPGITTENSRTLTLAPDSNFLLCEYSIWDLAEQKHITTLQGQGHGQLETMRISLTRFEVALATSQGFRVWNFETRGVSDNISPRDEYMKCVRVEWDGSIVYAIFEDGTLHYYEVEDIPKTNKPEQQYPVLSSSCLEPGISSASYALFENVFFLEIVAKKSRSAERPHVRLS
jgi:WD40 repeat protein